MQLRLSHNGLFQLHASNATSSKSAFHLNTLPRCSIPPAPAHADFVGSRTAAAAGGRPTTRNASKLRAAAAAEPVSVAPGGDAGPTPTRLTLNVAGTDIILETGEIGRQANGAVMARMGETVIYCTACCEDKPSGDGSFLPLSINYQEKFSAVGRTSGGYLKRERVKDDEMLVARLVDRPLRPMFAEGWANDTQVLQWVMSYDGVHLPEPLALTAAGAALLISDIPLKRAVAGVRVGWTEADGFIVNPTEQQMASSKLDLVLGGTQDAVLMIEGFSDFLTDDQMLEAVRVGSEVVAKMCEELEAWAAVVGKPKRQDRVLAPAGLRERVEALVGPLLEEAFRTPNKMEREKVLVEAEARVVAELGSGEGAADKAALGRALKAAKARVLRGRVLREGVRVDGRGLRDIRPITSRANVLPRTHGSCLFTRGETQALCVATLGGSTDAQRTDSMRSQEAEQFFLQYFFPPSSVGEVGRVGAPGRRELGHGELAQRALVPVIPNADAFPYTIRVESTITESNGSSSMASVCGGCLAMMDAGVPLKRMVAGVAMGLVLEPNGDFCVLSDILGAEDALGDMDFKVAGDETGITAFQMDIKVEGITLPIMAEALAHAREGRRHVLGRMAACSPAPKGQLSPHAPRIIVFQLPDLSKKAALIGTGGRVIKGITESSGAEQVTVQDDGTVMIVAGSSEVAEAALAQVKGIVVDPVAGDVYRNAKVVKVATFGVFVELGAMRQALLHSSEWTDGGVPDIAAVVSEGDQVDVAVLDVGMDGRISVSRRAVLMLDEGVGWADAVAAMKEADKLTGRPMGSGGRGAGAGYVSGRGRGGAGGRGGQRRSPRPAAAGGS